jgi:Amj-like protein
MDTQLFIICILTFIIHLVGTLAYAARIAGVRTRRIAISFSLFNILILVSRTSNSFQGPFLAKRIENNIALGASHGLAAHSDVPTSLQPRGLGFPSKSLDSASVAPNFLQRRPHTTQRCREPARRRQYHTHSNRRRHFTLGIALNVAAIALWTTGVFASLYAGYLNPALRVTSSTLSAVVNGVATILMFVFIDPQMSVMTDDVVEGKTSEPHFRRAVVWLVGSRLAGTVLAQVILLPAAMLIVSIAEIL